MFFKIKQMKHFAFKNKKFFFFFILLLLVLTIVGWHLLVRRTTAGGNFSYTLDQVPLKPNQELIINFDKNTLFFSISFRSGSGNFEKAKLVNQENIYKIVLSDTNNRLEEMIVSYDLSGRIVNIPKGKYNLQIVSGNKTDGQKILAEKEFEL